MQLSGLFKGKVYHSLSVKRETRSLLLNTEVGIKLGHVKLHDALIYLLDNSFIRFGTQLNRHIVGIPMCTNCAPLIVDLFLFCYEKDFMVSLSYNKEAKTIQAFNSTSRYLDDLLNINNSYFEGMVVRVYSPELRLKS